MRKFIQNILAASIVIVAASAAQAQYGSGSRSGSYGSSYSSSSSYTSSVSYGTENELITNFTTGTLYAGKACKDCDSATTIILRGHYLRTMTPNVQAGVMAGIESYSGGNSDTRLTLMALGVYNFDTSFKQSFFVQGGLGIYPVPKDNEPGTEGKLGILIGAGKRFPIWGNVNYIPTASLVKKGDIDFAFDIQFLNFSIMF